MNIDSQMDKSRPPSSNQSRTYIQPNSEEAGGSDGPGTSSPPYHSREAQGSNPDKKALPAYRLEQSAPVTEFVRKQLQAIRDGLNKLVPDILKTIIHELRTLTETRSYGSRYSNGLPEQELENFHHPRIVILRGMTVNLMYHAVIAFGNPFSQNARFAHINDVNAQPEFMDRDQFSKFLENEGAPVMSVYTPEEAGEGGVPDLQGMRDYLKDISSKSWKWELLHHNCLTFCLNILKAGGCDVRELEGIAHAPRLNINHAQGVLSQRKKAQKKKALQNLTEGKSMTPEQKKKRISRPIQPGSPPSYDQD